MSRRMWIAWLSAACLLASTAGNLSATADATTQPSHKARVISFSYQVGTGFRLLAAANTDWINCAGEAAIGSCAKFHTRKNERYLTVKVRDLTGKPVAVSLYPFAAQNPEGETLFCGSGTHRITPAAAWVLTVNIFSADPACPTIATSGKVTLTLSSGPLPAPFRPDSTS